MTLAGRIVIRPGNAYLIKISRTGNCGQLITVSWRVDTTVPMNGVDRLRLWMVRIRAMRDGGDVTRTVAWDRWYMYRIER